MEEAELRKHNAVCKYEAGEEQLALDPRFYIPLRFFKTIRGFHKVGQYTLRAITEHNNY
jgi:hypothetical protein